MAGELASAAISGGSGLLGNILDWFSNKATNKTNLKINQMNNEFNEKMMERQLAYNTDMWNKQNEYNDPSAQVERLKRAGINPVMAMQGNPQNTAASAMGVNPASASSAAPQQAWQPSMEGIAQGAQMLYERRLQSAKVREAEAYASVAEQDAIQRGIDNETRARDNISRIRLTESQEKDLREKWRLQQERWLEEQKLIGAQFLTEQSRRRMIDLQTEGINLQNIAQSIQNDNLPAVLKMNLAQAAADIALKVAQKGLTERQAEHEIEKQIETQERSLGYRIDSETKAELKEHLIEEAKNRAYWSGVPANKLQLGYSAYRGMKKENNSRDSKPKKKFSETNHRVQVHHYGQ